MTDDLISRQAAVDALNKLDVSDGVGISSIAYSVQESAISAIQHLPSAQQWIPCSERLPEEHTRVIGYMAWHAMTAIEHQHGRWYSIDHLEPLPNEAVSHWMPLPKPPKEREE